MVGLGIGASSTLFGVVNALLLRPLPFRDLQRLVWVTNHDVAGLSGQTTQVMHLVDPRASILRWRYERAEELRSY